MYSRQCVRIARVKGMKSTVVVLRYLEGDPSLTEGCGAYTESSLPMRTYTKDDVDAALDTPPSPSDGPGMIYGLRVKHPDGTVVLKVGRSIEPEGRTAAWECQCWKDEIELLWAIPTKYATKLGQRGLDDPVSLRVLRRLPQGEILGRTAWGMGRGEDRGGKDGEENEGPRRIESRKHTSNPNPSLGPRVCALPQECIVEAGGENDSGDIGKGGCLSRARTDVGSPVVIVKSHRRPGAVDLKMSKLSQGREARGSSRRLTKSLTSTSYTAFEPEPRRLELRELDGKMVKITANEVTKKRTSSSLSRVRTDAKNNDGSQRMTEGHKFGRKIEGAAQRTTSQRLGRERQELVKSTATRALGGAAGPRRAKN
ncbi:hypothetical protein B0H13DRAFT_1903836 [Mycena leptocephala]|nr:hypothetical protein B0H13DRAFT_1903836 [Mycena leptocephala]